MRNYRSCLVASILSDFLQLGRMTVELSKAASFVQLPTASSLVSDKFDRVSSQNTMKTARARRALRTNERTRAQRMSRASACAYIYGCFYDCNAGRNGNRNGGMPLVRLFGRYSYCIPIVLWNECISRRVGCARAVRCQQVSLSRPFLSMGSVLYIQ